MYIDVDNQGWWLNGDENYRIWVAPTTTSGEGYILFHNFYNSGSPSPELMTTDANASVTHSGANWLAEVEIPESDLLGVTFSANTRLRIGLQVNDSDSAPHRDIYSLLTGEAKFGTAPLLYGVDTHLYCVDFTLVN